MYKLIKIKPTGIQITVADGEDKSELETDAQWYAEQYPEYEFKVIAA
jgi:hypothetical protein